MQQGTDASIYKEGGAVSQKSPDTLSIHLRQDHIRMLPTEETAKIWKGYVGLLTTGLHLRCLLVSSKEEGSVGRSEIEMQGGTKYLF